jgi:DNA-binding transcriptional ArsR family regulator
MAEPRSRDPRDEAIELDPQNLRGLAHPLRMRILGLLRTHGPSTATKLAERLGQSSGATSYHLRQLASYGFVTEAEDKAGPGRERWWRAATRYTNLPRASARAGVDSDAEGFMRALAADCYREMDGFLAELATLPDDWDESWTMADRLLRLTPEEAKQLRFELAEVVDRYREEDPEDTGPRPERSERVVLQVQLLPRLEGGDES